MTTSSRKGRNGKAAATNPHGNVEFPKIPLSELGSIHFPILVYRGERNEASAWIATFRGLPGYLGFSYSEAHAIEELWSMIGNGPIYDVSKARGIEPSPENIRKLIARGKQGDAAQKKLQSLGPGRTAPLSQ